MAHITSSLFSCPELLIPKRKPVHPVKSKRRGLVSALVFLPNRKFFDIVPSVKWQVIGSPTFNFATNDYGMVSNQTNYLRTQDPKILLLPTSLEMTICHISINTVAAQRDSAMLGWGGPGDDFIIYQSSDKYGNSNRVFWRYYNPTDVLEGTQDTLGRMTTTHFVYKRQASDDSAGFELFINGVLDDSSSRTQAIPDVGSYTAMYIGNWEQNQFVNGGHIFAFFAFNYAMSKGEVWAHASDPYGYVLEPMNVIPMAGSPAPAPTGAIMNQFQGPNLGADLYNGTFQ